jgi:hypothetical protein
MGPSWQDVLQKKKEFFAVISAAVVYRINAIKESFEKR